MYLIFTHSRDEYCIDLVKKHLNHSGKEAIVLFTDSFPLDFQTLSIPHAHVDQMIVHGDVLSVEEIEGIWIRKWAGPGSFPDPRFRNNPAIFHESAVALEQFVNNLNDRIFQLDRLKYIKAAEDKLWQLKTAVELGLKIPETRITNHPQLLHSFLDEGNKSVKMHTTLSWGMEGSHDFFYTQKIKDDKFPKLGGIEVAPLIYQNYINKLREYRVCYIDGNFYCGVIPESISQTQTDWRTPGTKFEWSHGHLPKKLESQLTQLMSKLHLKFGVMDILEDENKEFYFLEVNPIGEWGMLEKFLNLPISRAIADTLVKYSK